MEETNTEGVIETPETEEQKSEEVAVETEVSDSMARNSYLNKE